MSSIKIIDCDSKKTKEICRILSVLGAETETLSIKDLPSGIFNWSGGIIISGSPVLLSETDTAPYIEKFLFVKNISVPVLGICFGHQIIGMLYGGKIQKDKECRRPINIKLLAKDAIFEGLPENPVFGEDHTESISLPLNFEHIATSEFCKVEAIKHKEKPLYGVQFHPEVSGENGKILLKNFLRICKVL